jgi:hypothetical protein
MADPKEPMIGKSSRPSPIDYDAPLTGMKVRDLLGVLSAHTNEQIKTERIKPEHYKPEYFKPDYYKPEYFKEFYKPEFIKPDYFKGGGGSPGDPVEQLAERVAEVLKSKK